MKKKLMLILVCIIIIIFFIGKEIYMKKEDNRLDSKEETKEEVIKPKEYTLKNVWIIEVESDKIKVFADGEEKAFHLKYSLSEEVEEVLADLFIENEEVVKISIKPDIISGKVLSMTEEYIEIEQYGKIKVEKEFQIYKTYDTISQGSAYEILVGYNTSDFVVSEGKICGVLIKEVVKPKDIRVLLKSNTTGTIFHKEIELTSDSEYTIEYGKKKKIYSPNKIVKIKPTNPLLKKGRLHIYPNKKESKIEILSINRNGGKPKYRGKIEIALEKKGLTLINELSLEEYLYSVIPSEMPVSYGLEALKVQAVCARSYAYTQLTNNSYREYGAHVDDSTSYQVYNNTEEQKVAKDAVNSTYGQVLEYKRETIPAYYFSTSCGYTASAMDVWGSTNPISYLVSSFQGIRKEENKESPSPKELSSEKAFYKFINSNKKDTYDSNFAWYRWKTKITAKSLKQTIDKNLKSRYEANPQLIQTKQDGSYVSVPIDTVGKIENIKVSKRGSGGIATEIIIQGSMNTIKVSSEYNIRALLESGFNKIIRNDKSTVNGLSLLPSAFFVIDSKKKDGKLDSITITGGGYGHGVGMSQNGAKAMCDMGKKYDEVLKHYYKGIKIGYLYTK